MRVGVSVSVSVNVRVGVGVDNTEKASTRPRMEGRTATDSDSSMVSNLFGDGAERSVPTEKKIVLLAEAEESKRGGALRRWKRRLSASR